MSFGRVHCFVDQRPLMAKVARTSFGSVHLGRQGIPGGGSLSLSSVNFTKSWSFNGYLMNLINDVFMDGFYFPGSVTITKINLSNDIAPVGSPVTVQITKNGTGIAATNVSLAAGSTYNSDWTTISGGAAFVATDRLGIKLVAADSAAIAQSPTVDIMFNF